LSLKYEGAIPVDMLAQFGPRVQLHWKKSLLWFFLVLDKCFYFLIQKRFLGLSKSFRGWLTYRDLALCYTNFYLHKKIPEVVFV